MRRGELFSLCVLAKFESNTLGFYIEVIRKMKEGVCCLIMVEARNDSKAVQAVTSWIEKVTCSVNDNDRREWVYV